MSMFLSLYPIQTLARIDYVELSMVIRCYFSIHNGTNWLFVLVALTYNSIFVHKARLSSSYQYYTVNK